LFTSRQLQIEAGQAENAIGVIAFCKTPLVLTCPLVVSERRIMRAMPASLLIPVVLMLSSSAWAQDRDPWFATDKYLHFSVSAGIASAGYGAAALVTDSPKKRVYSSWVLGLTAGLSREIWKLAAHGDPSYRDLTWDIVGTATGTVLTYLFDRLVVEHFVARERCP
jgi:putative lipoprotein